MLLLNAASNIVIAHAESNCTIAASEPTPMVILSLGHSGSTVTALRLAKEPQIVEAWRRLLRFLGVAAWEVSHDDVVGASNLVETTPYAQAETVRNYEEVAARLAPTAYAHLLH